jgi:diguanylate cyclase (GGDEF)-like protein
VVTVKRNVHFLLVLSLALSLAVLWYVDWRAPNVHLGPLAAVPLFLLAYRIGLWPTLPLAFAAAIALAVADYDPYLAHSAPTDMAIDSAMLLVAFAAVAIAADRMRDRDQQVETLKRRVVREQHRAEHDPITRLPNRVHFEKLLDEAAQGPGDHGLIGIVVADIDDFKEINDRHGHRVGDRVLREVARRLASAVRSSDAVARIGGDEFGFVLRGVNSVDDVRRICAELRLALAMPVVIGSESLRVGLSIGYSAYPIDGENFRALVDIADRRMYEAKASMRAKSATT